MALEAGWGSGRKTNVDPRVMHGLYVSVAPAVGEVRRHAAGQPVGRRPALQFKIEFLFSHATALKSSDGRIPAVRP